MTVRPRASNLNESADEVLKLSIEQLVGRLATEVQTREADRVRSRCEVQSKDAEIARLREKIDSLKQQIELLQKLLHGPKSERRNLEDLIHPLQLWLEGMGFEIPDAPPQTISVKGSNDHERKAKPDFVEPKGPVKFTEGATVIVVEIPNPEVEGIPEDQLELVEVLEATRVAQFSSPYVVVKVVRKVYRKEGCLEELSPPELPEVLPGTIFDVSFLAGLAVNKYQWHLPVYRQHQAIENAAIFLDRGHLIRVLHQTAELLEPIYDYLKDSVLASSVLAVDETPTPAGRGGGQMKKGYFWAYFGDQLEVFFEFSPSRGRKVLDETLAGFRGHLLSDGYIAYESYVKNLVGVIGCQCWNHARREFLPAEKRHPDLARWVLVQIQNLYRIEKKARGKPPPKVLSIRQAEAKPIVEAIFAFLKKTTQEGTFTPSDPFLKAANYVLARKQELGVFLTNAEVPIDTNHVEREIRPQAVGRKNWMFHVTEEGAKHAAVFYSLIRSCVLAKVNPTVYLVDVLQRIDIIKGQDTELLIPRLWKEHFEANPLRSPLLPMLGQRVFDGHCAGGETV